jgi:hypothetical protein
MDGLNATKESKNSGLIEPWRHFVGRGNAVAAGLYKNALKSITGGFYE